MYAYGNADGFSEANGDTETHKHSDTFAGAYGNPDEHSVTDTFQYADACACRMDGAEGTEGYRGSVDGKGTGISGEQWSSEI
jgi:hypothetical protein